jgi:chromosome segregation ATPase
MCITNGSLHFVTSSHSFFGAGHMPGVVFGRLCSCIRSTAPDLSQHVSNALSCTTSLSNTILVSNRATAVAVLNYLQESQSGCLKCLIADESGTLRRQQVSPAFQSAGGRMLGTCIEALPGKEAVLPVVQKLLAAWVLVPDWKAASTCASEQRGSVSRFGFVTR